MQTLTLTLLVPLLVCTAVSGLIAEYSLILMSEIPYVLITLASLLLLEKSLKTPENRTLFWVAIAVSVLPMHCRKIGLSFSVAWIVLALWRRQYRYAFGHIAALVLALVLLKSFFPTGS